MCVSCYFKKGKRSHESRDCWGWKQHLVHELTFIKGEHIVATPRLKGNTSISEITRDSRLHPPEKKTLQHFHFHWRSIGTHLRAPALKNENFSRRNGRFSKTQKWIYWNALLLIFLRFCCPFWTALLKRLVARRGIFCFQGKGFLNDFWVNWLAKGFVLVRASSSSINSCSSSSMASYPDSVSDSDLLSHLSSKAHTQQRGLAMCDMVLPSKFFTRI